MKILVSGSTGLVGSHLVPFLREKGDDVTCLIRDKKKMREDTIFWNPKTGEIRKEDFEGFDAVIHLAGKNIASGLWTKHFKKELFTSRCRDTWLLSQVLLRLVRPPKCLITASAIGIYGNRGEEPLTEESMPGKGFLADLCKKWEEATTAIENRGTRVVHTRFGIILSPEGGMLKRLIPMIKWGGGAILGSGKQYLPWIALDDVCRGISHVLEEESIKGALNFVSPMPLRLETFMKTLGLHLHRPIWLKIGEKTLSTLGGEMAREMFLSSIKAYPEKLTGSGFVFQYPNLKDCLQSALR